MFFEKFYAYCIVNYFAKYLFSKVFLVESDTKNQTIRYLTLERYFMIFLQFTKIINCT